MRTKRPAVSSSSAVLASAIVALSALFASACDDPVSDPCLFGPCENETLDLDEDCEGGICPVGCMGDCVELCDGDCSDTEICTGPDCPCEGDSCLELWDEDDWEFDDFFPPDRGVRSTASQQPLLLVTLPTGERAWMSLAVVGTTTCPERNGSPAFAHFGGVMPVALP